MAKTEIAKPNATPHNGPLLPVKTMADFLTPPPELIKQWVAEIWHEGTPVRVASSDEHIAARAAQWGADQELEACREWLWLNTVLPHTVEALYAARRPKPRSLKEQALEQLDVIAIVVRAFHGGNIVCDKIRRALEALDD
jgi:hypothetical protein